MKKGVVLPAVALVVSLLSPALARADGAAVYQKCKGCHGAEGKGLATMPGSDLTKGVSPDAAKNLADGKGKMPGFGKTLKAEEQKEVLEYVKGLKK